MNYATKTEGRKEEQREEIGWFDAVVVVVEDADELDLLGQARLTQHLLFQTRTNKHKLSFTSTPSRRATQSYSNLKREIKSLDAIIYWDTDKPY